MGHQGAWGDELNLGIRAGRVGLRWCDGCFGTMLAFVSQVASCLVTLFERLEGIMFTSQLCTSRRSFLTGKEQRLRRVCSHTMPWLFVQPVTIPSHVDFTAATRDASPGRSFARLDCARCPMFQVSIVFLLWDLVHNGRVVSSQGNLRRASCAADATADRIAVGL